MHAAPSAPPVLLGPASPGPRVLEDWTQLSVWIGFLGLLTQ